MYITNNDNIFEEKDNLQHIIDNNIVKDVNIIHDIAYNKPYLRNIENAYKSIIYIAKLEFNRELDIELVLSLIDIMGKELFYNIFSKYIIDDLEDRNGSVFIETILNDKENLVLYEILYFIENLYNYSYSDIINYIYNIQYIDNSEKYILFSHFEIDPFDLYNVLKDKTENQFIMNYLYKCNNEKNILYSYFNNYDKKLNNFVNNIINYDDLTFKKIVLNNIYFFIDDSRNSYNEFDNISIDTIVNNIKKMEDLEIFNEVTNNLILNNYYIKDFTNVINKDTLFKDSRYLLRDLIVFNNLDSKNNINIENNSIKKLLNDYIKYINSLKYNEKQYFELLKEHKELKKAGIDISIFKNILDLNNSENQNLLNRYSYDIIFKEELKRFIDRNSYLSINLSISK